MASFKSFVLVMLVGLAFGEDEQPDLFANPRPYPFFVPLQATEDAPQFRNNINNFLNGFRPPESLPRSAFQACVSTNNLNRESGTVQLLPGVAPRRCIFIIQVPDKSKSIEFHCSKVAVGLGAVLDLVAAIDPDTQIAALEEGKAVTQTYNVYAIKYEDKINSGTFTCDWRQVKTVAK